MTFVNTLLTSGLAQGKVNYADQYGSSTRSWIVVPVTFGSRVLTTAILDTGGLWCVLDQEDAEGLDFNYKVGTEVEKPIAILGGSYTGWINTITVSIEADVGRSLTLESEVFIPERLGARRLPN